ncbi:hypothetical protein KJA13_00495 [Patescibacteria group bacterium]|nr:hypothetical protein [Patescibacteria group bacterium]
MKESKKDSRVISEIGRTIAGGYADHQDVRKSTMNRIRSLVRHISEGIPFDQPEEKKEERTFDSKYRDGNLLKLIEMMFAQGKITKEESDYLSKALELAKKALSLEQSHKGPMRIFILAEPVWKEFLSHVPGIGGVLASNLIAKFANCERYDRVSSLWRHCGLHLICPECVEETEDKILPVPANVNGKCPKCGKQGVAPRRKKGRRNDYDGRLKTFAWNIADCLIKKKSPVYYEIYLKEKERQLNRRFSRGQLQRNYGKPYKKSDTTLKLLHAHNRARRKMVKIFLQHYWVASRELAGLSVIGPYVKDKLEHEDIVTWRDVLKANKKRQVA